MNLQQWFIALLGTASTAAAARVISDAASNKRAAEKYASCNTPDNRAQWCNGFNISTDYEKEVPYTGVTRYVCIISLIQTQYCEC
jgi:hypothetical protein